MPSESTPDSPVKNESGRWFEVILKLTNDLRSEYQLALHDQAIDHATNLSRLDTVVEKIRDTMGANRKDIDKLLSQPAKCPPECQQFQQDLSASVDRRFGKIAEGITWRNWLMGILIAVAVIMEALNVLAPRLLLRIQELLGTAPHP